MGRIFVERNFEPIFTRFNEYFITEILRRGWKFLVHDDDDHFYIESLVEKFYNGLIDFDLEMGYMTILWDDEERILDLEDLAGVFNIPVTYGTNPQLQIVEL